MNSFPRIQEADECYKPIYPHEARLRNLTYSTEIYVDVQMRKLQEIVGEKDKDGKRMINLAREDLPVEIDGIKIGEVQAGDRKFIVKDEKPKVQVFLGKVPVMIRSHFC